MTGSGAPQPEHCLRRTKPSPATLSDPRTCCGDFFRDFFGTVQRESFRAVFRKTLKKNLSHGSFARGFFSGFFSEFFRYAAFRADSLEWASGKSLDDQVGGWRRETPQESSLLAPAYRRPRRKERKPHSTPKKGFFGPSGAPIRHWPKIIRTRESAPEKWRIRRSGSIRGNRKKASQRGTVRTYSPAPTHTKRPVPLTEDGPAHITHRSAPSADMADVMRTWVQFRMRDLSPLPRGRKTDAAPQSRH